MPLQIIPYYCPWCHCKKNEFGDLTKRWSIDNTNDGARKLEKANEILNKKPDLGYVKKPILKIEFKNCVIDMLHLLLRIWDNLLKLLLFEIFEADGYNIIGKCPHLVTFLNFLENNCKINNASYLKENKVQIRSLSGNEIINILENSLFLEKILKIPKIDKISSIWNDFYTIFLSIKKIILISIY